MKATPIIVVFILTFSHLDGYGQIFQARDSGCINFSLINSESIINGALTYNWNFGNGQTSTLALPSLAYSVAGTYPISLNVTTATTDRVITEITVTAIPNTWNDGVLIDPKPDLYFKMKDNNGTIIYNSPAIFDKDPPVKFTNFVLMKPNLNYTLEIWEYDLIGQDDFLAYIPINTNNANGTLSNGGATISYLTDTGKSSYSYTKTVKALEKPTVTLTSANGLLTTQSNPSTVSYTYIWLLNGNVIAGATTATYRPTTNGSYSVRIVSIADCSATSNTINVSSVTTLDLDPQNSWKVVPNPLKIGEGFAVNILSDKKRDVKITIYNAVGQLLNQKSALLQTGENYLNLLPLKEAGIYYLKISSTQGQKVLKAVVQ